MLMPELPPRAAMVPPSKAEMICMDIELSSLVTPDPIRSDAQSGYGLRMKRPGGTTVPHAAALNQLAIATPLHFFH